MKRTDKKQKILDEILKLETELAFIKNKKREVEELLDLIEKTDPKDTETLDQLYGQCSPYLTKKSI